MPLDETPTHIRHKARRQRLLEDRIPVHVSQVGCALNVTKAGQAALRVLGQELRAEADVFAGAMCPTEASGDPEGRILVKMKVPLLLMLH